MNNLVIKSIGNFINLASYIAPRYAAKKGFAIFSSPQRLKLKADQIAFLDSAENHIMKIDGNDVRVYKWGNGSRKILFLHGWQSHSFRWVKFINTLKNQDYTIYAFDGPASGQTTGDILNIPLYSSYLYTFIENYGPMDFYAGHSLGAFAILYTFFEHQELEAKALLILGCPGNAQDFVDVYVEMLGLNKRVYNLILDVFVKRYQRKPSYFTTAKFGQGIQVPGLIIHDKEDDEAPFELAEKLHKNWANSEFQITEGLGHKLRSQKVVDQVANYLESAWVEQESFKN